MEGLAGVGVASAEPEDDPRMANGASPVKRSRVGQEDGVEKVWEGIRSPHSKQPRAKRSRSRSGTPTTTPSSVGSPGSGSGSSPGSSKPKSEVIGRAKQFKLLNAALGGTLEKRLMPGALFLWGPPAAGKTYTVERVLEGKKVHLLKIHAGEILCGRRAFFETLVKQLVSINQKVLASNFKCDSLRALYTNFDLFYDDERNKDCYVAVIVRAAESLRGENEDILQFLVSLPNIIQCPISVIFVSTLPPGQFMPNILDHTIIPVNFPQYSMEELTQIIADAKPRRNTSSVSRGGSCYEFYVKMIVSMFYYVCRDLRKLFRLATCHWDAFHQMVEESPPEVNLTRLWKRLEPQLKSQFFEMNSTIATRQGNNPEKEQENPGRTLSMPANAKYLLIASYLATHNPPSSDKRFFVKSKTGRGKKNRVGLKTDANNNAFVRSFELNRLNAIFDSIQEYCDDRAVNKNRNINFMTLLTTLCHNKLIQHLGEDSTGNQKYKCLLDYDTVLNISRAVNFELNNYLHRLL